MSSRFSWAFEVLRKERYDAADQARTVKDPDVAASLGAVEAELTDAIGALEREARSPRLCHCGEHDERRGNVCCPAHGHREPPGHSEHCPERAREVAEYRRVKKARRS